jgi:hypothetical protein
MTRAPDQAQALLQASLLQALQMSAKDAQTHTDILPDDKCRDSCCGKIVAPATHVKTGRETKPASHLPRPQHVHERLAHAPLALLLRAQPARLLPQRLLLPHALLLIRLGLAVLACRKALRRGARRLLLHLLHACMMGCLSRAAC